MSPPFARTARLLSGDSPLGIRLALVSAMALLAGWGVWFGVARVPVYETSQQARVEVQRATHPVDAPVGGRVIEVDATLDALVAEGDVLLRLDASLEQLQLDEIHARIEASTPQVEALRRQAQAERAALATYLEQLPAQLAEASSRWHEEQVMSAAGRIEADRSDKLFAGNLISEADRLRAHAEADRRVAAEMTARTQLERLRREAATGADDRRTRAMSFDREAAALAAQLAALQASLPSLEYAVARRTVRAPAAGRIGETAMVRVGQVLPEGGHIATIVAPGNLRVVASFAPSALGRVHEGQRARVRLDAFPWTEYGVLQATVSRVGSELHEGMVRVELTVEPSSASRIPLQHGLPGRVDVTLEQATPARLVLRAAGKLGT